MARTDFPYRTIGVKGRWEMIKVKDFSDGEQKCWPGRPHYRPSPDENYLVQLAAAWVKEDGREKPGVNFYLEELPHGYATFEQDQQGGPQVYKRLFGHPSGRFYDSIVKYQVHFLWLMRGMQGDCTCVLCSRNNPKPIIPRNRLPCDVIDLTILEMPRKPREPQLDSNDSSTRESSAAGIATGRARRDVKRLGAPYAHDEEGTEDVFKVFVKRLESAKGSNKGIDEDFRETNSIDWRAEHEYDAYGQDLLPRFLTQIEQQHSFIPRVGELVLWCPDFLDNHYLTLDAAKAEYKFYSFDQKCFHGFPAWRAGVVTQVPSTTAQNEHVDFPDLLDIPKKSTALNTAGFRVETLPDPNDVMDKSFSKQYRFVPLRNIRPLSHWQKILRGIPNKQLHPSIKYALTCMTSISLLEKFRAVGLWPHASVFCKGLFLGPELITIGDTVRLKSHIKSSRTCTDVMIVDSIRLNLLNIKPEHVLPTSSLLSSKSSITLVGRAFTTDIRRHYEMPHQQEIDEEIEMLQLPVPVPSEVVKTIFRPVGTGDYGSWYHLHSPNNRYEVSYDQVLGRLYEADAVRLWTGQLQQKVRNGMLPKHKPSLDFDVGGICAGRKYASQTDSRIPELPEQDTLWFWADTRAEALAIETFNGVEVGKYHDIRDDETLQSWQAQMRIINGQPVTTELLRFSNESFPRRGRPAGSKVVDGKLVKRDDPGYEEALAAEFNSPNRLRLKTNSQMVDAAFASTDDEDSAWDDPYNADTHSKNPEDELRENLESSPSPQRKQEKPSTKAQIMGSAVVDSIEGEDESDGYVTESDLWLNEPLPPVRGGTEESEGGDYDPKKDKRPRNKHPEKTSKFNIMSQAQ